MFRRRMGTKRRGRRRYRRYARRFRRSGRTGTRRFKRYKNLRPQRATRFYNKCFMFTQRVGADIDGFSGNDFQMGALPGSNDFASFTTLFSLYTIKRVTMRFTRSTFAGIGNGSTASVIGSQGFEGHFAWTYNDDFAGPIPVSTLSNMPGRESLITDMKERSSYTSFNDTYSLIRTIYPFKMIKRKNLQTWYPLTVTQIAAGLKARWILTGENFSANSGTAGQPCFGKIEVRYYVSFRDSK